MGKLACTATIARLRAYAPASRMRTVHPVVPREVVFSWEHPGLGSARTAVPVP
jgi:hypothetical protein